MSTVATSPAPLDLYGCALSPGAEPLLARHADGTLARLPLDRWRDPAGPADLRALARLRGPVLDLGCGPGRHVHALARRGVLAVGVDMSPAAARLARRHGATVLEASIFDRLPGAGTWNGAVLLDGNIGIGGDPTALLGRVAELLSADGEALVELDRPGGGVRRSRVRLEHGGQASAWFDWAEVAADAIAAPAHEAGLRACAAWQDGGRWFTTLTRR